MVVVMTTLFYAIDPSFSLPRVFQSEDDRTAYIAQHQARGAVPVPVIDIDPELVKGDLFDLFDLDRGSGEVDAAYARLVARRESDAGT